MYYSIKKIAKLVNKSPHIIERIIKTYSISPENKLKGKTIFKVYNMEIIENFIEYEANIKPIPQGMALITQIRDKYKLQSVDWPSIVNLRDAPQPKGKGFDSAKRIRPYYCENEWETYLIALKKAGHPLLIKRTSIPGETLKTRKSSKEEKIRIHPSRQRAYKQAAESKKLNAAFNLVRQ